MHTLSYTRQNFTKAGDLDNAFHLVDRPTALQRGLTDHDNRHSAENAFTGWPPAARLLPLSTQAMATTCRYLLLHEEVAL